LAIFVDEGIIFKPNTCVGLTSVRKSCLQEFDAVILAIGAEQPRDLPVEGRELKGVYYAMDYLMQQNKVVAGQKIPEEERINAKGQKSIGYRRW
jgi:glutamate synthase (NADPH) small chain